MSSNDHSGKTDGLSTTRENYNTLIKLIEETLEKIYSSKTTLVDDTHDGMVLNISTLIKRDELEQSIAKNEWVIEQISERNMARHKELVELIREKTELRQLIFKAPVSAGGIRRNTKIEEKIEDIDNRIESIISTEVG